MPLLLIVCSYGNVVYFPPELELLRAWLALHPTDCLMFKAILSFNVQNREIEHVCLKLPHGI